MLVDSKRNELPHAIFHAALREDGPGERQEREMN